jgi:hypothetical protein
MGPGSEGLAGDLWGLIFRPILCSAVIGLGSAPTVELSHYLEYFAVERHISPDIQINRPFCVGRHSDRNKNVHRLIEFKQIFSAHRLKLPAHSAPSKPPKICTADARKNILDSFAAAGQWTRIAPWRLAPWARPQSPSIAFSDCGNSNEAVARSLNGQRAHQARSPACGQSEGANSSR